MSLAVIGRQISHFYVIRSLGAGGMGVVYEAQDTRLPRSVAIKVLKDDLAKNVEAVRRFKREARLASSLNHPNICTILDVSENDSCAFIAMELLEGVSLKARLMRGPPPLEETLDIIRQVIEALAAAHEHGIIHRDITPANIFLTSSGLVKLLDFGLATQFPSIGSGDSTDDLTGAGTVMGTIHYMSPEQLAEGVLVDYRCDFFALGAVLYEMATGARPFDHVGRHGLSEAIQRQPHVPMHQLAPQHPAQLGRVIDTLLAKNRDERYQTAAALRGDIDALAQSLRPRTSATVASTRVRVTATLIADGDEDTQVPAVVIDSVIDGSRAGLDQLARNLCQRIGDGLLPETIGGYSTIPDAYHAFKRGQHVWASSLQGGWRLALEHFQHAVDRDPQFARAHVALANAYNFLGFYSIVKPAMAFSMARRAADRAIAINGSLGRAFIELGLAKFGGDWDWDGSEAAFRRGLILDPSDAMAHIHYSWLLMLLGRSDVAFAEAERGYSLAPSSRLVAGGRAQTLYLAGEYDRAIYACTECLRFDNDYVFALHLRGLSYLAKGDGHAALADLERAATLSHRTPFYLGLLGRCYAEQGLKTRALAIIDELNALPADTYVPPQCYVYTYAGLGEGERALEYQENAYADGASPFNYLFPGIRQLYALSPHHKKRLEQMRLVV